MKSYLKFLKNATIWIVALLTTGVYFTGCDKDSKDKATLTLSTSTLDFQYAGGTLTFSISSDASEWQVSSGISDWLTVTPTEGSNDGTVSVTAAANTVPSPREGTITVIAEGATSQTVKVTQEAAPAISLALSVSTLEFESAAATKTFDITSNVSWTISSSSTSWLTVTPASGSNDGTASVKATANTASKSREATITVNGSGVPAQTVKVTQAAVTLDQSWRSSMQTAMNSYPTHSYSTGDRYKGQTATVPTDLLGAVRYEYGDISIGGYHYGTIISRQGVGIYIIGDFEDNRRLAECPDCKIYAGNWYNNLKEGIGSCYDKTGARIYYGEFKDNKPVGTYPTAPDYNNTFEIAKASNGSYYLGENVQGKRTGYGITLYANRDIWFGPWKDGVRDGYGIQIYFNGTLRVGTWKGDTYSATTRSQVVPTTQTPLSLIAPPILGAKAQ